MGEIHDLCCDAQRCPCCGGQFISCDCDIQIIDTEKNEKMDFDKSMYYKILGKNYKLKNKTEDEME